MDTWRSDNVDDADGEVIEIIPIEEYDKEKAKARASLSWVLCKAYQENVPQDFKDPFYETGEGNWHIKPRLANLLASSEVYCLACSHMFGESSSQWTGHMSIIQVLSRKGIYAVDVTETILMQSAPFKLKAHISLINALMTALSREIASIERITQSVRRYATFNASSELPSDTEDAILFWVNKVCATVQKQLEQAGAVSSENPGEKATVPLMESLLKDMGDGCSLAALISFYCPTILNINDVCLKSNVGIADSLYNLRLIRSFCERHLPIKTCHLSYEDLLYTHQNVRENVIMMIAEIFYWFELKRLPIVTGGGFPQTSDKGDATQSVVIPQRAQSAQIPNVPISNVTKQSFHRIKTDTELRSSSTPDIHRASGAGVPPRMPLLNRRHQHGQPHFSDDHHGHGHKDPHAGVHRTHSLTTHDVRPGDPLHPTQSVLAWQEKNDGSGHPVGNQNQSGTSSNNLLANVSIDSDMNASFSSGSIDLGELDNSPRNTARSHDQSARSHDQSARTHDQSARSHDQSARTHDQSTRSHDQSARSHDQSARAQFDQTDSSQDNTMHLSLQQNQRMPQHQVRGSEHMELESANSGMDFGVSNSQQTTARTDGDESLEPLMPARLKPAKEKTNNHSKEEERGEMSRRRGPVSPNVKKKVVVDPHLVVNELGGSWESENTTPVPGERQSQDQQLARGPVMLGHDPNHKKFDAFFVRGSVTDSEGMLTNRSDVTVAESYIVDHCKTPEAARAAGIPIIDNNSEISPGRRLSREGSIASTCSKSSGDFSDHESHKIHIDHKTRETSDNANNRAGVKFDVRTDVTDPSGYIIQKPKIMNRQGRDCDSGKTMSNFAQLKHMKDIGQVENTGFVYMQHGKDDEHGKSSLKDNFQQNKTEKKTTFAPLPNQTSWQNATVGSTNQNASPEGSPAHNGSASQELTKLRMKLEEKRRAIERKKHSQEIQQQKLRQRLGKAAFLHVVSKTKDDGSIPDSQATEDSRPPARMTTSDSEIPGTSGSSAHANSRMTSSSPMKSPTHQKIPRPFSRDDIQQTIENVRKKWFQDDDLVAPRSEETPDSVPYDDRSQQEQEQEAPDGQITPRPVFDRRSTSVERITSLAEQTEQPAGRQDMSPQMTAYGRRSASVERSVPRVRSFHQDSPETQRSDVIQSQQQGQVNDRRAERRSTSVDRTDSSRSTPRQLQQSQGQREEKPETYEEYNSSLDQLNRSLTDLQGEIMKLSLKQKKAEGQSNGQAEPRARSRSPPRVLEVRNKNLPEKPVGSIPESSRSRTSQPQHSQSRSASEPRQIPLAQTAQTEEQVGNYQSHTLPRQPGFHQGQSPMQQYMGQVTVAGPAGPVYGTPNQYVPVGNQVGIVPTAQQYGSYIMGPNPGAPMSQIPPGYQQSPPQGYPGGVYPGQPYMSQPIMSPQTQPYGGAYTSPPHSHFQQLPQPPSTYTTSVLQQQMPPTSQQPMYGTGNQFQSPGAQLYQQQQQGYQPAPSPPQHQTVPGTGQTSSSESNNKQTASSVNEYNRSVLEQNRTSTADITNDSRVETQYDENDKSGGFFVSFNESSPRRNKPQLSEKTKKAESEQAERDSVSRKQSDSEKYGSSVIADFAQQVAARENQDVAATRGSQSMSSAAGNQSVTAGPSDAGAQNDSQSEAVGFVIADDESSLDKSAEEEMLKKKERIEKMRQKRQEEQERKRQKLEQEAQRKKEAERLKQEESERRKSEEKARREQIFKQYLQKKEEDEEGPSKPVEKSRRDKPRPKSMFVKLGGGDSNSEGGDGTDDGGSAEGAPTAGQNANANAAYYISPAPVRRHHSFRGNSNAMTTKPKRTKSAMSYTQRHAMRKAVSCNQLSQNGDKSLAYGGLTHRRPPSPDLYRLNKGQRSNASSEAGSDYSGPKLFVKPSLKSNRHIITNAISHCCLAGTVNTEQKGKVLEEIAKSSAKHFIILFRDTGCGFRSLYGFDPDTEECVKIMGVGPRVITNDMVEKYYKYNSGAKSFSTVSSTKHISVSIDALVLQNTVWKTNKAPSKGYR